MTRRPGLGCLIELAETLVLTVLVFLGIQSFVAQPFMVQGASMETTLLQDQYLLIDKLTPRWAPYSRGDIVVLAPPSESLGPSGVPFIKRVIGLPGDHIQLQDGTVYVNGTALDEPYLFVDEGVPQRTDPIQGGLSEWLVPEGQLFVMGDHRRASSDSRMFGAVEIANVIGRAWLRYWPIDTFGILPVAHYPAND